jgi:hypothetical protein
MYGTIARILMSSQTTLTGSGDAARAGASSAGSYIQPTLGHGLRIWWAFFWRNTAISFVLAAALGAAAAFVAQRNHFILNVRILTYCGYAIEYITAIFVVHFVVQKKFRTFRIIFTPQGAGDSTQILPPVFSRTFRIWWTFMWRSVVYRIVLALAMSVPLGVVTGAFSAISPQASQLFNGAMQLVISGAVGLFTIYSNILDEDIAGFRVSLAPRNTAVWPEEVLRFQPAAGGSGSPVS